MRRLSRLLRLFLMYKSIPLLCFFLVLHLMFAVRAPCITTAEETSSQGADEESVQAESSDMGMEASEPVNLEAMVNTGEDQRLSLDYKDAELSAVLKSLAYTYNLNLVSTKDIKGNITLSLNNVTIDEALEAILTVSGYSYHRKGNLIYIYPSAGTEEVGLITTSFSLKYLTAGEAERLLSKSLSPRGDIRVNEVNNSIVVRDYPPVLEKIKSILEEIDTPPSQVLIEAKIVDITSKDYQNLGAKYTATYTAPGGLFKGRDSSYSGEDEVGGTVDVSGPSSYLTSTEFTLDSFVIKNWNITAEINALIQDQKAHLLASPSIATLNGKEARIVIGEKVPYKEKTQTTTGTTETTKFIDVGTTLRVTPQISPDGYITMAVHPEVSSVKSLTLDAGPYITTREADAVVRVKDGETLVIGGLIKNEDNRTRSRIPVLGYVPIVGALFGNKSSDLTQTELAVFITPHIIRTPEEKKRIRSIEREEVYVNIAGTAERALVNYLFEQAHNLEINEGIESRRKDEKTRMAQALDLYRQIASQFPGNEKSNEALFRAGIIYYTYFRDYAGAKRAFSELVQNYPESRFAPKSKYLLRSIQKKEESRKRAQEKEAQAQEAQAQEVQKEQGKTPSKAGQKGNKPPIP